MSRLAGKIAIVTGGGQGIGLGIAQAFAAEGASLVLTGRTVEKLHAAADDLEALGAKVAIMAADARARVDAESAVALAVERFGGLDILVNNAQTSVMELPLEEHGEDLIEALVESGLYGSIYHMQAALPHLKRRGGGSIINLGSRQGIYGAAGFAVYAATKEGIRGLSRSAAREWGEHGIRVNVINPSALSEVTKEFIENCPEQAAGYLSLVSLRRWGTPLEDIGPVAVFLASDDSRYVSGQTINVDGGMEML